MFWWLAQHVLTATILAGMVALLCRWGRFGPALRHGLWLLVLVKLLMPPVVHWPWALPFVGSSPAEASVAVHAENSEADRAAGELLQLFLQGESKEQEDWITSAAMEGPWYAAILHQDFGHLPNWLGPTLLAIWGAGAVGMAVLQTVRMVKFRRLLRDGRTPPRRLVRQVGTLATLLSVRPPGTRVLPGIGSPFVWGLHRAQLLWPAALLGRLADGSWRCVIAHELAHLRRRDHWVAFLQMLAECVWWWNPVFWYVRRQLRLNAELACDAWVVSALPEERRAYAEALIEVTEHFSQTALAPALGISSGARQAFERRLTMIMRDRVPCKVPVLGMLVLGILGLAAMPGWSQVQIRKTEVAEKPVPVRVEVRSVDDLAGLSMEIDNLLTFASDDDQDPTSAAGEERERKLRDLEQKIQALRKELDTLRGGAAQFRSRVVTPPLRKEALEDGKYIIQYAPVIKLRDQQIAKPDVGKVIIEAAPKMEVVPRIIQGKVVTPEVIHLEKGKRLAPEAVIEGKTGKEVINLRVAPEGKEYRITTPLKAPPIEHVQVRDAKPIQIRVAPAPGDGEHKQVFVIAGEAGYSVALSRVTYKLPAGKAEALSSFLGDNVKAPVLETKVDGDSLVVTTTPEVQHAIGAFISLLHAKTGGSKEKPAHKGEGGKEDDGNVRFWREKLQNADEQKKHAENILYFYERLDKQRNEPTKP